MKKIKSYIKLIFENQEELEERNINVFEWVEKSLPKLGFEKQPSSGGWQVWTRPISKTKKIFVLIDVIQNVPMKIEMYGQKLYNGKWHRFPKSAKSTSIFLEEDKSIYEIIKDFKQKLKLVFEWAKRI